MYVEEFLADDQFMRLATTDHFDSRIKERDLNKEVIFSDVKRLNRKLVKYNNTGKEIAVVDKEHNLSFIMQVRYEKVVLITVINKADIKLKNGTELEMVN